MEREQTVQDLASVASRKGLSEADLEQLRQDRILITNETYKQVFTPYIEADMPLFVTSDSLLNAYHVLFEESVRKMERASARRLPTVLRTLLVNLEDVAARAAGDAELVAAAQKRATIVLGTAMRLLEPGFELRDEAVTSIVEEEVKKIVAAQARMQPRWLGRPTADFTAVDYSRYKVRGFYTSDERLAAYFRAVAWLQSIPFRLSKDDELLAILMLGCSLPEEMRKYSSSERSLFEAYEAFLGRTDDWDLVTAADRVEGNVDFNLKEQRRYFLDRAKAAGQRALISDQVRYPPGDPGLVVEPCFRIVSAYRLPDAVLFQRTTDLRVFRRAVPNGLEVCAVLGSEFARQRIREDESRALLETLDDSKALFDDSSLYANYLNAVAVLLDGPEPDAPAFMKSPAWQIKCCGTALAGWAQLRHTWVLQGKLNVHYACANFTPPGFVEPEPQFFRKMAQLAGKTGRLLEYAGTFETDYSGIADALMSIAGALEESKDPKEWARRLAPLAPDHGWEFWHGLHRYLDARAKPKEDEAFRQISTSFARGGVFARLDAEARETIAGELRGMAGRLRAGDVPDDALVRLMVQSEPDLESLWKYYEQISRRLELLAHKQLRGMDFDQEDGGYIRGYGTRLARVMLYEGNSYVTPLDDAPRIVDVFDNPQKGVLCVGTGRPRALYVLYPWRGQDILCKGAILPYHEFLSRQRLTDSQWKNMLDDKDQRPDIPPWLKPIVRNRALSVPEFDDPTKSRGRSEVRP
jgi:hypothetical protein